MKSYTHFTLEERESIYLLLKFNKKVSEIAKELGRNKSSVSREIRRNSNKKQGNIIHSVLAENIVNVEKIAFATAV